MLSQNRNNYPQTGEYHFYFSKRNNTLVLIWIIFVLFWDVCIIHIPPLNIFLRESPSTAFNILWTSSDRVSLLFLLASFLFTTIAFLGVLGLIFKKPSLTITPTYLQTYRKKYPWGELVAAKKGFFQYTQQANNLVVIPASPVLYIQTRQTRSNIYTYFTLNLSDQLGSLNPNYTFLIPLFSFSKEDRQQIISLIKQHITIQPSELLLHLREQGLSDAEIRNMGDFDDDDFV